MVSSITSRHVDGNSDNKHDNSNSPSSVEGRRRLWRRVLESDDNNNGGETTLSSWKHASHPRFEGGYGKAAYDDSSTISAAVGDEEDPCVGEQVSGRQVQRFSSWFIPSSGLWWRLVIVQAKLSWSGYTRGGVAEKTVHVEDLKCLYDIHKIPLPRALPRVLP